MNKILVVDDDAHIRELVQTLLQDEGLATAAACNGLQALDALQEDKYDLCILDIMMPEMDGYETCRQIRLYSNMPILMLTAKGETGQKVKGFELGADDYLTKPFASQELVVRVRALLKRYNVASSQVVQVGGITVDSARFAVLRGGRAQDLPRKEFELLFLLASYPGKTLGRDKLIEEVWGYDFEGNERTLDVHVGRLRERFPEKECGFKISTVRGLGYRLEEVTQNEA